MRTSGFDTSRRFFVDSVQVWRNIELFALSPFSETKKLSCDLYLVQCACSFLRLKDT